MKQATDQDGLCKDGDILDVTTLMDKKKQFTCKNFISSTCEFGCQSPRVSDFLIQKLAYCKYSQNLT